MSSARRFAPRALAALLAGSLALPAFAATSGGMSDAFKGFGSNGKDPIQIEADSLEVLDKDRNAVFTGNVHVVQKDTVLKTLRLRVFYAGSGAADLAKTGGDAQSIRRFEAEGKVLITQKDQTVTGDRGWFDMTTQTAQITGAVVLTQGKNVARGDRLSIDLKSGQYKLDGAGRVQLILESQKPAGQ
ncbi:MAG: LPS ABC transporter substrate-binding protein LptA [Hyphomicrobiales bacterium]|nr:LPS ABC transporter substrate-binding protein LptA [Hyphomicrobiales bacterium]